MCLSDAISLRTEETLKMFHNTLLLRLVKEIVILYF